MYSTEKNVFHSLSGYFLDSSGRLDLFSEVALNCNVARIFGVRIIYVIFLVHCNGI